MLKVKNQYLDELNAKMLEYKREGLQGVQHKEIENKYKDKTIAAIKKQYGDMPNIEIFIDFIRNL